MTAVKLFIDADKRNGPEAWRSVSSRVCERGEGGRCFILTSYWRNLLGEKAKRTFVRNWCPGKHIGLRWGMIQSPMCLWMNLTSNSLLCIFDELQSRNRKLSLCGGTVQILFLVREGHVILSVPLWWGFTSLPDAHQFLVNTKRRLSVSIKFISGQISIVWFTVRGKNFQCKQMMLWRGMGN